jgi:nitrogen regulatory protein PII
MKLVKAFVRMGSVDPVVCALLAAGAPGITISHVHGIGYEYDPDESTFAPGVEGKAPKVASIEVVCREEEEETSMNARAVYRVLSGLRAALQHRAAATRGAAMSAAPGKPIIAFVLAFASFAPGASGGEPTPPPVPAPIAAAEYPRTPEEHQALADDYATRAADHRGEADRHRRMLAAHDRLARDLAPAASPRRGLRIPADKAAKRSPAVGYREHCERYISGAEWLAEQAEGLAEFHGAMAREAVVPDPAQE